MLFAQSITVGLFQDAPSIPIYVKKNLHKLKEELGNKTYKPSGYKSFIIFDPKRRLISAAPYKDRVVHHALCNIIEPIFEKSFIYSTYANRLRNGTHKALGHFVWSNVVTQ